jgi:hypothetical protein
MVFPAKLTKITQILEALLKLIDLTEKPNLYPNEPKYGNLAAIFVGAIQLMAPWLFKSCPRCKKINL